jgi:hypothetical protein
MPRVFKQAMTAGEFLRVLEADPDYVSRRAAQDEKLAKLDAFYREAEAPLISELAKIGIKVGSVYDLVNGGNSYDSAIPLLLEHLRRPYPDAIREGIARALGVPATRAVGWQQLVNEYRQTDKEQNRVKDGLAVALSGASNDSVIQDLIDLVRDQRNGTSRVLLLLGIRKSKRPEAKQALNDLADDPELALEISSWRKTSKSIPA